MREHDANHERRPTHEASRVSVLDRPRTGASTRFRELIARPRLRPYRHAESHRIATAALSVAP